MYLSAQMGQPVLTSHLLWRKVFLFKRHCSVFMTLGEDEGTGNRPQINLPQIPEFSDQTEVSGRDKTSKERWALCHRVKGKRIPSSRNVCDWVGGRERRQGQARADRQGQRRGQQGSKMECLYDQILRNKHNGDKDRGFRSCLLMFELTEQ